MYKNFTDHLNAEGLGNAVEIFSTRDGFRHGGLSLAAAFNPAVTLTERGTLLAFAEGRLGSSHDDAPKTVLMNRSDDMGRTWQGMRALTAPGCHFGPRPYTININGGEQVCVLVCYSRYHLRQLCPDESQWVDVFGIDASGLHPQAVTIVVRLISDDDGATWRTDALTGDSDPFRVPEPGNRWVGFGDFTGTVETIPAGPYAGRRIVGISAKGLERMPDQPPDNMRDLESMGSSILYSDDGIDWKLGGVIVDWHGNEAAVVPFGKDNGLFMLRRWNSFRGNDPARDQGYFGRRLAHLSCDGGQTWSQPFFPEGLPHALVEGRRFDHQCLPSLCAVGETLVSAMPAGRNPENGQPTRSHGVIGYSEDGGRNWRVKPIDAGLFSYATLYRVNEAGLWVVFSRGTHGEQGSFLRAFTMDWVRERE